MGRDGTLMKRIWARGLARIFLLESVRSVSSVFYLVWNSDDADLADWRCKFSRGFARIWGRGFTLIFL